METAEFRRWFGASKVVDAQGRPLVVYHGTGADVGAVFRPRTFFTPRADVADVYAFAPTRQTEEGAPNVMPVFLSMINPYVHDDAATGENLSHAVLGRRGNYAQVQEALMASGHDGVLLKNYFDLGGIQDQFMMFHPAQVKSAIGNCGAFDSGNPSIYA